MRYLITLIMSVTSSVALAAGWATHDSTGRIKYINPEGNVVRIHFTANDASNPDQCQVSNILMLKGDTKNEDRQYSLLMAAFMANKPVKLYVSGCESGWGTTYPKLTAVYVYD